MATDLSKLATELQKKFPSVKPNGSSAPPPKREPMPAPSIPPACGISKAAR